MKTEISHFDEHTMIHNLKHYLPAQAPLKDFIHHNTLHAFQNLKFDEAMRKSNNIFGYKVYLTLVEYRTHYDSGRIKPEILKGIINKRKGESNAEVWLENLILKDYNTSVTPRIGKLRANWKSHYHINLDSLVHPILFRVLSSYLDQGISIWNFPFHQQGFLSSIRELERNTFTSFFKTPRAKELLLNESTQLNDLLAILVGDSNHFEQYVFDQQFAHQGWSGMVSAVEDNPQTLLDTKKISLKEMIIFETILEIDVLDKKFGSDWKNLSSLLTEKPTDLFSDVPKSELSEVYEIWQESFEWSYYDQALMAIKLQQHEVAVQAPKSFQAAFCIDDRESSMRRYLADVDNRCETFSTPGFFGVEFFYQPINGKFYTKLCPAPVTPKYLIKEVGVTEKQYKEHSFTHHSHSLVLGYLSSQTLGFWSAIRLFLNVFRPSMSPATASSFKHMDKFSKLTIENENVYHKENGLQIGFTIEEMANRVEAVLKSIGMIKNFAPIVYMVGHGSSSTNNPHYAAYDCGACSGRPGSVNARVFCSMTNNYRVRILLQERGIELPDETQFLGALHDTTRDDIDFYDVNSLNTVNFLQHSKNEEVFKKALDKNAKERSRRFISIDTTQSAEKIHEKVRRRSVSLFEPRPELNHATNALCIVSKREMVKGVFLDRRAFLNSFNYEVDPEGTYLFNILKAATPVCGGINLEYFFSRVDNQKLGAGTKLPHNVMGLFGVANGIDGDLRPGLPSQMIEMHDPVRLLIIVEHFPEVILKTIQKSSETYEWFINEWVHLVAVNPVNFELSLFKNGNFEIYEPFTRQIEYISDLRPILESNEENLPVYLI